MSGAVARVMVNASRLKGDGFCSIKMGRMFTLRVKKVIDSSIKR